MLIYGLCAKAWPLQCVVWLLWSGWRIPRLWDCQFTGGGWQRDSRPGPELRARCINMEWKFLAFKIQPELRPHRVSFQCVRLPYLFLKISFKPQRKLASKFFSYITSQYSICFSLYSFTDGKCKTPVESEPKPSKVCNKNKHRLGPCIRLEYVGKKNKEHVCSHCIAVIIDQLMWWRWQPTVKVVLVVKQGLWVRYDWSHIWLLDH